MLTCAFAAQKRKAASKSDFPYPEWVVCINSLMLFERGVNLPEELKLSKKAVQELKAIRSWAAAAALTVGPDGGAQPAGAAEGPPLPRAANPANRPGGRSCASNPDAAGRTV